MKLVRLAAAQLWLAALVSPALALDWKPDAARILGDPSYLPTAGQVSGRFDYTYSANLYDVQSDQPSFIGRSTPSAYDRSSNSFLPELDYGITDDITVFANLGWGNSRNREAYIFNRIVSSHANIGGIIPPPGVPRTGGSGFGIYSPNPGITIPGVRGRNPFPIFRVVPTPETAYFRALGADNPIFGLTWRAIDQASAPVSVDLTGTYSPDIFQARSAGVYQTGTLASGGQNGSAQLAVSRETRALTLRVFGTFAYAGRRNDADVGGSQDLRSAPHPTYSAGLQSELRVLPWLAINSGVTARQSVQYDRFDVSPFGTSVDTIKPAGVLSPSAGIVVPLIDQHLVAEASYQHDFTTNERVRFAGGIQNRFFHQESNLFTARVLFAFGGTSRRSVAEVSPPADMAPAAKPARTYLVFFDWDRADLSERARQIVAQAAQASRQAPTRLDVRGYTDLSGGAAYNQRLSERRARSVAAELVRDGVAHNDISTRGFGETDPLVPTAPGVREPQNRRVEIVFR